VALDAEIFFELLPFDLFPIPLAVLELAVVDDRMHVNVYFVVPFNYIYRLNILILQDLDYILIRNKGPTNCSIVFSQGP
jgi:hypothetical protein